MSAPRLGKLLAPSAFPSAGINPVFRQDRVSTAAHSGHYRREKRRSPRGRGAEMMASRQNLIVPVLRGFAWADGGAGLPDGQLLERFLLERDEAAFTALVHRLGPMVLGVCRRILGNEADAEDAFQATFVVLSRKAATLTERPVLGDWLQGVARRTALKARSAAACRRVKEMATARPEALAEETRNDWLPLLDRELSRLPEKYRLVVVLCDLEGKTRQEAA